MKKIFQTVNVIALALVLSLGLSFAYAATATWGVPTKTPPEGNVDAPINVSGAGQGKYGGLLLGLSPELDTANLNGLLVLHGKVGIGTSAPAAKLDVAGGVRIGSDTTSCSSANEGTLRYKTPKLQLCTEGRWRTVSLEDVIKTFNINAYPWDIVFDGKNAWTADWSGSVSKITPGGVVTTYSAGGQGPQGIAFDGVNIWATNSNTNSVVKINTQTGASTTYTGTGIGPAGIAFDGKNMWTANNGNGVNSVTKIGPTGVMTTYTGTGLNPGAIAFDGTNMWTANEGGSKGVGGSVTKITPSGSMTTYATTEKDPIAIAFDGTNMWVANALSQSVTKVTPTGSMTTYTGIPGRPRDITFDGTNMWTANERYNGSNNTITKITPSGVMTHYDMPGDDPLSIVFDGDNTLWVGNYTGKSVSKVPIAEL